LISVYVPTRNRRSMNSLTLKVPTTRLKTYGDRSFSMAAPILWNPLPDNIKNSSSLDIFKSQLKHYLFKNSYWLWFYKALVLLCCWTLLDILAHYKCYIIIIIIYL
jgi:hypothetical protein